MGYQRQFAVATLVAALALAGAGGARAEVAPFAAADYGGFRNVLPPGTNGLVNPLQLVLYELDHAARPPHNDDQLAMYRDLLYGAPGLQNGDIANYYKDASFGVRPGDLDSSRTVSPRSDVTIVRDRSHGVPHIYGSTRGGVMFGAGYAAAHDRLFLIDVLRHLGRGQLSSFAGGAPGNREMDHAQLLIAPYSEQELTDQVNRLGQLYGADGARVEDDIIQYVAGINEYIGEARLDPTKMPGEYLAIGRPQGADPWTVADVVSTASLVGGIFGKGGGDQLSWGRILQSLQTRLGRAPGSRVWRDFRNPADPEAPTTVHTGARFPYLTAPTHPAADAVALPDPGSLKAATVGNGAASIRDSAPARPAAHGLLGDGGLRGAFPQAQSNALLVSGAHSASGHPIAVMGPQVGYFTPQILMEQDLHGPGIDADGVAFPGVNLYVELGHGPDYAWSATSAGQSIIDDLAVPLCEPDGSSATTGSNAYLLRGQCTPMVDIVRTNTWAPNLNDATPAGSDTFDVQRTAFGPVIGRATVHGRPVAYTQLRSTFGHEIDSSVGFSDFNNPDRVHDAHSFQRAAGRIGYTFNWLYADDRDIAYFNSGNNPVRDPRVDPLLPNPSKYEWRGFDPSINTATYTPFEQHPQIVNQDYLTSWNNKQAPAYQSADGFYGPVYRSQLLDDRIRAATAGGRKATLSELITAMEDAGTVDLRGDKVLPWVLKVIETAPTRDPRLAAALDGLRSWVADGAHRRDLARTGTYAHSDAIRVMDAWFPLLVRGEFEPAIGSDAFDQLASQVTIDNDPNNGGAHLGSAYDNGFYGYVQKDLRDLLFPATAPKCASARRRTRRGLKRRGGRAARRVVVRRIRICVASGRPNPPRRRASVRPGAALAGQASVAPRHRGRRRNRRVRRGHSAPAVLGRFSRVYCGGGSLAGCRQMLLDTLAQALASGPHTLYADSQCTAAGRSFDQECFDAVGFRAVGAITQPMIPWINRPTFQQAVEVQGHRPR